MTDEAKKARNEYLREYRAKNKEKIAEYQRNWFRNNPEKRREYVARYWERKADQA